MQAEPLNIGGGGPLDWQARADALRAEGLPGEALNLVLPRLQQGKIDIETLDVAAMCFLELGDGQTALGLMEKLVQQWPTMAAGWGKLAMIKEAMGDKTGAIEAYRGALKRDPKLPSALHGLDKLAPFASKSAKAARARKLCKSAQVSVTDRAFLFNTLGQIEQRAQRHRQAFRYFAKSNAVLGGSFKGAAIEALVAAQENVFQPRAPKLKAEAGPRVVFVCGMPRSGTTLVENILLRHASVQSIGESKALKMVLKSMRQHVAATGRGTGYWDWFNALSVDELAGFRQNYLARALSGRAIASEVIIDKMPLNCLDMGAAHMLLPDAQFVFLSRHPLDTALSNFVTCFSEGMAFSQRLEWIGQMTHSVYRAMEDYRAKLGGAVRVQSYAALVRDPAPQIRALLEAIELPWEQACLTPEQGGGVVRTASVSQVREGINTAGIGKWAPYAEALEPVVDALGGPDWIADWAKQDRAWGEL